MSMRNQTAVYLKRVYFKLLTLLGIFIIVFGRKGVKVNASAIYPILREMGNTEEVWDCYVGDHKMQRK